MAKQAEKPLTPTGYTPEQEQVHRDLMEMGLLLEVRPKSCESKLHRPVGKVTGKPVSETIIEERR